MMRVESLSVGYGDRQILMAGELTIGNAERIVVMGPSGAGKSSLLLAIAGLEDDRQDMWVRGYWSSESTERERNTQLMRQKARLSNTRSLREELRDNTDQPEQWLAHWGIAANPDTLLGDLPMTIHKQVLIGLATDAADTLVLLDEPLGGVAIADEPLILETIQKIPKHLSLLMILHDKQLAKQIADRILLVSGGRILADLPVADFFSNHDNNPHVAGFLQSGSYWAGDPIADEDQAAPAIKTSNGAATVDPVPASLSKILEFHWVVPQQLGGSLRPGLIRDLDADLAALARHGVTKIVSLTQTPLPQEALAAFNITGVHFPIGDMEAPTLAAALVTVAAINDDIRCGESVLLHCRAGLGRTGTMLAAVLIDQGLSDRAAIDTVQAVNPRYIQSQLQYDFLRQLNDHLRAGEEPFVGVQ